MSIIGAVSFACLLITGGLATWAVFSRHYDDTLIQRLGLSLVAIACIVRAYIKLQSPEHAEPPPEVLLAQIGLATFAVGSALRLYASSARRTDRRRTHHRRGAAV
jgi:hypothetical protein